MKRFSKIGIILLVVVLCAAAFLLSACNDTDPVFNQDLVTNGSFEDIDTDTNSFDAWSVGYIGSTDNYTANWVEHKLKNGSVVVNNVEDTTYGSYYAKIANTTANFTYLYQTIPVVRNATYRITYSVNQASQATISSEGVAVGAHLTFLENPTVVLSETTTYGSWTDVTLYVKSKNSDNLTLCLSIGTEAAPTIATASFDKVTMERMETIPASAVVEEITRIDTVTYSKDVAGLLFVILTAVLSVGILIFAYVGLRRLLAQKYALEDAPSVKPSIAPFQNKWVVCCLLVLGAGIVRLIFALVMYGFGAETQGLVDKAASLIENGLPKFYTLNSGDLTSPGMLYALSVMGGFAKLFGLETTSIYYATLIKIPAIVCDMLAVGTIYMFGRKYVGNKVSAIFSAIYALLPVAFVLSGIRGSAASMLAALLLLTFILLIEKKYISMFVAFTFALLLGLDAMAVAPLILTYLIYLCSKEYKTYQAAELAAKPQALHNFRKMILLTALGTVGVFIAFWLLSLPFAYDYVAASPSKPFFIIGKYRDMMTAVTYFVSNNFNLYGMVGMNNKTVNNTASVFNLIFILVLVIYVITLYIKNRNRLELMLLASFIFAIISVFTLKHDETYMFLSLAMLLAYIMVAGEKRLYVVFIGLATLNFLNIAQLMSVSGFVAAMPTGPVVNFESLEVFYIMMSVFTVLFALYYGYLTYVICNNDKRYDIPPMKESFLVTTRAWFKSWKG